MSNIGGTVRTLWNTDHSVSVLVEAILWSDTTHCYREDVQLHITISATQAHNLKKKLHISSIGGTVRTLLWWVNVVSVVGELKTNSAPIWAVIDFDNMYIYIIKGASKHAQGDASTPLIWQIMTIYVMYIY